VARAEVYLRTKWHLDPSNHLATIHQRYRQTGQRSCSKGRTVTCNGRPKMDCPKVNLSFKDTFHASDVLLRNAFETTSPFTYACETFRLASLHIKSSTSTKFPAVQADRGRPLSSRLSIRCCCGLYSARWPDWFHLIFSAEIPVAVVESELLVAEFIQVFPLYTTKLMNT